MAALVAAALAIASPAGNAEMGDRSRAHALASDAKTFVEIDLDHAPTQPGAITGNVFWDLDVSSTLSAGDEPIAGASVTIYPATGAPSVVPVAADGTYSARLPKGTYTVTMNLLDGFSAASTPLSRTLVVDGVGTVDFGYVALGHLTGYVYTDVDQSGTFTDDDVPIPGRAVTLAAADGTFRSVTTDATGRYDAAVMAGEYRIAPSGGAEGVQAHVLVEQAGTSTASFGLPATFRTGFGYPR